jgi:hypothetical protein
VAADTRLVADKRSRPKESTIAIQRVAIRVLFTVHARTL